MAARSGSLRQLLRSRRARGGGTLCGTWSLLGSLSAAQTLAGQGFDFVVIDREHSVRGSAAPRVGFLALLAPFYTRFMHQDLSTRDASAIAAALSARGVAPAVRIPFLDRDGKSVMRALDCGCTTVVVPNVRNADEVSRAVQASLFPPYGKRGCNPFVPAASLTPQFDCASMVDEQNATAMVVPMIENANAVENIESIVAVDGLRALLFGPFDLSISLGDGGIRTPRVEDMISRSVECALRAGVEPIMPVFGADVEAAGKAADLWRDRGVICFTVGIDSAFLAQRSGAFLQAVVSQSTPRCTSE